ncbi:uncharacterized protein LOC126835396 [Adelges cooleyi]|uniref:uncharacterized protein LOC126835396 n=1 Tax=Adelges cooleyi TaxID=133065 RepID=UPI00217F31EF|nr:uncharacterized protein LOC126835396 [Adelges cooleyi]XP_050423915.1 uncharacterized protein LOC126835396 [Adelges cooleyi]XP_050423916.1 uncharacterized protein LOC126835396 [Adelges cooleyi]XP_050423917.1 uncharacterized protein LOC126835396 [Adelges cooleyi]XP_050423919.1 uncharacterized protein LOC126835396 [Adelges cooleyi]XP_050423920.1 uncharacterized protein LOC126835396 [Adelges cooleyi]XP_050423921.1 uncharacterized protein LOC126835396 [Adelges cooleyi]
MEICGMIDVKVPSKGRKFGSWKAWNCQWCEILYKNENRVVINMGHNKSSILSCLAVPNDAVLYRIKSRTKAYGFGIFYTKEKQQYPLIFLAAKSETESQKWMKFIRDMLKPPKYSKGENEYAVSVIDNEHSKAANLTGLYGTLSVKTEEILVTDPYTGKIKVTLHWTQMQCSYLPLPATSEDLHRVCTIRTNSKFKAGEGDLEMYCTDADKLHMELSTCPRPLPRIATTPLPPTPREKTRFNDSWENSPATTPPRCLLESRRMSRSEGDLQKFITQQPLLRASGGSQQHLIFLPQNNLRNKSSSHFLLTSVGLLLTTPGYSEPNSMQDLQTLDHQHLGKRLQDIADDDYADIRERSDDEDYEEILSDDKSPTMNDLPPPLPPRKPKTEEKVDFDDTYLPMNASQMYVTMANISGNSKLYVSGPVPI